MLKNSKKLLVALVLVLAMTLSACGKSEEGSKELTIYSPLPDTEIPVYLNAFEAKTGIKVNYVRLSAGETLAKLQVEKNNPGASVWFGGPADTFIAAKDEGLLEEYKSPELENIAEEYKDKDNLYSPIYVGALGFAVNKDWFKSKGLSYPETWDDLLKPEFKNELAMAHPGSSGTAYTVLATILQVRGEEKGWEYFEGFNANVRQYTKSGAAPARNAALGEVAIGIVFSHDALTTAAEGYPLEVVFPKDGTGYEVGGIALIKNAKESELENAKTFIDWALSKEAQEMFEQAKSFRLPVNKLAKAPEGAVNIAELNVIEYDFTWAGKNRVRLVEEFTNKVANQDNLKQ